MSDSIAGVGPFGLLLPLVVVVVVVVVVFCFFVFVFVAGRFEEGGS
jgi:Na+/glutamate symporter